MMEVQVRRRGVAGFGVFTLLMVAVFVGLGVWQLQRRAEKRALITALTERLAAAPGSLPMRSMKSLLIALQFHHKAAPGRLIDREPK